MPVLLSAGVLLELHGNGECRRSITDGKRARNWIQFGYRHTSAATDFIPRGGNINDASVNANWWVRNNVNVTALLQYEKWNYPLLASTPQTNWTSSVQVQFYPQTWRK
jgi:hypothetical protein